MQNGTLRPDGRFLRRLSTILSASRLPNGILLLGDSPQSLDATVDAAVKLLLNGDCLDLFTVRPTGKSQQISAESVREVIGRMHLSSRGGGLRVAAIHGADRLHRTAANALLKILEEPPSGAFFLLSARRIGDVLPTIRSRCHVYHCGHVSPFECNVQWERWLDCYGDHVRNWLGGFAPRHAIDAYALMAGFRRMLDSIAADGQEDNAIDPRSEQPIARRTALELMLADCSLRLARVAKEIYAEADGDFRRRSTVRIARLVAAIDLSIWLVSMNCSEIAAIESFLLPQV
jgi:hypothetical protein